MSILSCHPIEKLVGADRATTIVSRKRPGRQWGPWRNPRAKSGGVVVFAMAGEVAGAVAHAEALIFEHAAAAGSNNGTVKINQHGSL